MGDLEAAYSSFAADHGLEAMPGFAAGLLTPLLVESGSGQLAPAARGRLGDGAEGVLGHLAYTRNKTFRFSVALTEVASSTAFVPRLFCIRSGRSTRDDEFYGFEARDSKLWTESTALNDPAAGDATRAGLGLRRAPLRAGPGPAGPRQPGGPGGLRPRLVSFSVRSIPAG